LDWNKLDIEVFEGGENFVVARPSLVVGLIGGQELVSSATRILDTWLDMRASDLPLYVLGSNSRTFRALTNKSLLKLRSSLVDDGSIKYCMIKDAPQFDIGTCSLQFIFDFDSASNKQATVALSFPPSFGEVPYCDSTAEAVLNLLHAVRPRQAYSSLGFSLVFGREYESVALPRIFAYGRRYVGFDLPERFTEIRVGNFLKSAYWITGASLDILQAHGLEAAPKAASDAGIDVRQSDGFVTYRAGRCPPVGDINRKAPDAFAVRSLHTMLRPALLRHWASTNVFGLEVENIDSWFSRFDGA
jgi:hypothetical protein